jgi:hypothetical protein
MSLNFRHAKDAFRCYFESLLDQALQSFLEAWLSKLSTNTLKADNRLIAHFERLKNCKISKTKLYTPLFLIIFPSTEAVVDQLIWPGQVIIVIVINQIIPDNFDKTTLQTGSGLVETNKNGRALACR